MAKSKIDILYEMLEEIPVTKKNKKEIDDIKKCLDEGDLTTVVEKIKKLNLQEDNEIEEKKEENKPEKRKFTYKVASNKQKKEEDNNSKYPKELSSPLLEEVYVGMLLNNPKLITKFYTVFEDCAFEDDDILNLYKSVLFTDE